MSADAPLQPGIEAFLGYLAVERRLSANTLDAYRRDLGDLAADCLRHRLVLSYEALAQGLTADGLIAALKGVGYEAHELDPGLLSQTETDKQGRDLLMRLGVAGFSMMNVMLLSVSIWSGADGATKELFHWLSALIALPTAMRRQYATLMSRLIEAGGQVLLVTLEYQPEQQVQPPFSVGEMEVRTLFERDFSVEVLGRAAELDHPRVLSGQLSYFDEVAYRLIRRG